MAKGQPAKEVTLAEVAEQHQLPFEGDGNFIIKGVATLQHATAADLSFLSNPKYAKQLSETKAGALILSEQQAAHWSGNKIISPEPYLTYALVTQSLFPYQPSMTGIHPTAVIDSSVQLGKNVTIGAHAVIEARTKIADNVIIGHHCVVGQGSEVGSETRLAAHVTLYESVKVGSRVTIHSGSVIGSDGFGFAIDKLGQWHKIPQLGTVIIEDDVDIGANTTIDCGALGDTVVEKGVKLDNLIQIAHNVRVGAHTAIAGCAGVAGSTTIGKHCRIAGSAGIDGHLKVADGTVISAMSLVTKSIDTPGMYSSAFTVLPAPQWKKQVAWLKRQARKATEKSKNKEPP